MLVIRLQRMGKKKSPSFRLIVSEKTKDPQAGSLEILGHYNPVMKPKVLELKEDRIKHWIGQGAQPSPSVHNLLVESGVISGDKRSVIAISNKRRTKIDQKKAEAAEAEEADKEAEAAKKAEAAAAAAEEKSASTQETAGEEEKKDSEGAEGTGRDLSVQKEESKEDPKKEVETAKEEPAEESAGEKEEEKKPDAAKSAESEEEKSA